MFGININNCTHKPFVRKLKNGIYFHMNPNKHIAWYYNGCFYFGEWNNLPND